MRRELPGRGGVPGVPGLGKGSLHLGDNSPAIQLFQKGAIFSRLSVRLFIANRVTGVEGLGGGGLLWQRLWGARALPVAQRLNPYWGSQGPAPRPGVVGCVHTCVSTLVSVHVWMPVDAHV